MIAASTSATELHCFVHKSLSPEVQYACHVRLGEVPADAGQWWAWERHKIGPNVNCVRCGWRPGGVVFEEMKEIVSQLGKLADERPAHLGAGYLVDRPELLQHCLRCWAPCGCCVTYMSANAYVLTACDAAAQEEEHAFSWEDAKRAIEAFIAAEQRSLVVVDSKVEAVEPEQSEEKSSESRTEHSTEGSAEGSPEVRPQPELET